MKGEIYYTGGNIWCAYAKLSKHRWFGGEVGGYGCVFDSKQSAIDAYDDEHLLEYLDKAESDEIIEKLMEENKGNPWYEEWLRIHLEGKEE